MAINVRDAFASAGLSLIFEPKERAEETQLAAILARHGERRVVGDELPEWVEDLPTDDEG